MNENFINLNVAILESNKVKIYHHNALLHPSSMSLGNSQLKSEIYHPEADLESTYRLNPILQVLSAFQILKIKSLCTGNV